MATLETIYRNQLNRAPDAGGLAHYQAQIAKGRSIDDIRQEIASSPEAKSRGVGAYASGGGGGGSSSQSQAAPPEPKYNIAYQMEGLPTGGRGYSERYDALRAAAKARRDLFSGSGRKNTHKLGIKEGYSFVGGEGKTLVDTIEYRGGAYNEGGILNIYKDAPKPEPPPTPPPTEPPPTTPPPEPPKPQGPDYGQQISDAMAAADARMEELMNQFKIQQAAAEERQRLAAEAQRQQMLTMQRRDRAAGRAPNLQISGAGETPRTAGTQGFRRRKDQFRITPFQGIGGIIGVAGQVAQGAANKMVNI